VVIGLDLLVEGLVELHLAGRDLRLAQLRAGCAELEALAVHVVAVGDRIADLRRLRIEHAGGKFESLLGRQEVVIGTRRRKQDGAGDQEGGQESEHGKRCWFGAAAWYTRHAPHARAKKNQARGLVFSCSD
jgi:hypothetical protein